MKRTLHFMCMIFLSFSMCLFSCRKDVPKPPVVTTATVTEVSYTTAVSGGNVTSEGEAPVTSRGICWNTSGNPVISNNIITEKGSLGEFTSNLTNLIPNTQYYVRAYAISNAGTSYGDQLTFTTSEVEVPVLTTAEVTSITQTTATAGGNITKDRGAIVTLRGVCWSTSQNPTAMDSKTADGSGTGIYTSMLTGLLGNTTYFLRAYATNSAGTQYGNQVIFKSGPVIPELTTETVSSVSFTSCSSGGIITSDGGATVTSRGVCWSTTENPTTSGNKTENGVGTGAFVSSISGLTEGTTYYIRSYAINSVGTQYGNQMSFTTYPLNATDVDGNVYDVVAIGAQLWMKENLKTTRYQNGDPIGTTTPPELDISLETAPKYQWAYDDDESNVVTFGRLYTQHVVFDNRNVCPAGWHVPTENEFQQLIYYLFTHGYNYDNSYLGNKLRKSLAAKTNWDSYPYLEGVPGSDFEANNRSGFTGLPSGFRIHTDRIFLGKGTSTYWWSSNINSEGLGVGFRIQNFQQEADIVTLGTNNTGAPIRCLKD